jgi:hypothetical protein
LAEPLCFPAYPSVFPSVSPPSFICIFSQIGQIGEEAAVLATEQPIVCESLESTVSRVLRLRRPDDRAHAEPFVQEYRGFRHDQVGLQIFIAVERGQVRKIDLVASDRIDDPRQWRGISGFVVPRLEVRDFGPANAQQNAQNLRARDSLRQLRIQAGAALLECSLFSRTSEGSVAGASVAWVINPLLHRGTKRS